MRLLYDYKDKAIEGGVSITQMVEEVNAKEFKNFLTNEETSAILNFAKNTNFWGRSGDGFWDGRVIKASDVNASDSVVGDYLKNIKQRILATIKESYNINTEIYLDLLAIARWFPGMQQQPHSDNMQNTDHSHIHEHREYGLVIYLNDDFEGGSTFYPQHNLYINPEPGKMAVHPASTDHMHGVTKIEGAVRYTLTSFVTFNKTKAMQDF